MDTKPSADMGEIFADAAYSLHRFADICLCDGWDGSKVIYMLFSGIGSI